MNYPLIFIAVYFIIMNIITFILYLSDKRKAINIAGEYLKLFSLHFHLPAAVSELLQQ